MSGKLMKYVLLLLLMLLEWVSIKLMFVWLYILIHLIQSKPISKKRGEQVEMVENRMQFYSIPLVTMSVI